MLFFVNACKIFGILSQEIWRLHQSSELQLSEICVYVTFSDVVTLHFTRLSLNCASCHLSLCVTLYSNKSPDARHIAGILFSKKIKTALKFF